MSSAYYPASNYVEECGEDMARQRKPKGPKWKEHLTRRDLMKRIGVSLSTIARMDAAGRLPPSIRFGGVRLYRKTDVEKWEKEVMAPAKPAPTPKK